MSHNPRCVEHAEAMVVENCTDQLTAKASDGAAWQAESEWVAAWAAEWLADGTTDCVCDN